MSSTSRQRAPVDRAVLPPSRLLVTASKVITHFDRHGGPDLLLTGRLLMPIASGNSSSHGLAGLGNTVGLSTNRQLVLLFKPVSIDKMSFTQLDQQSSVVIDLAAVYISSDHLIAGLSRAELPECACSSIQGRRSIRCSGNLRRIGVMV